VSVTGNPLNSEEIFLYKNLILSLGNPLYHSNFGGLGYPEANPATPDFTEVKDGGVNQEKEYW